MSHDTQAIWQAVSPNAQIYCNFVDATVPEHVVYEEFQAYRQVMGIIGIVHCPSEPDIAQAYCDRFVALVRQLPNALAVRCLAFEPSEKQSDDIKGLVLIPNQNMDQVAFYVATLMTDFTIEMVASLADKINAAERKTFIPNQLSEFQNNGPNDDDPNSLYRRNMLGTPCASQISVLSEFEDLNDSDVSLRKKVLRRTASSSSMPLEEHEEDDISTAHLTKSRSASMTASSVFNAEMTKSSSGVAAKPKKEKDASSLNATLFPSMNDSSKEKKRLYGRTQKCVGDLFLLSGCWHLAHQSFQSAVDSLKSASDYMWLAGAMEGLFLSQFLIAMVGSQGGNVQPVVNLLKELNDRYREIIALYDKADVTVPLVDACLKVGRYMAAICRPNDVEITADHHKPLVNSLISSMSRDFGSWSSQLDEGEERVSRLEFPRFPDGPPSFISKQDATWWLMRIWESGIEKLPQNDQVRVIWCMAESFGWLGFYRKHAFFLRQIILLVTPHLVSQFDKLRKYAHEISDVHDFLSMTEQKTAVLAKLKQVRQWSSVISSVHLSSNFNLTNKPDKSGTKGKRGDYRAAALGQSETEEFSGWPAIQIDILKEEFAVAELSMDFHHAALILEKLLLQFSKHMEPNDQGRILHAARKITSKMMSQSNEYYEPIPFGITNQGQYQQALSIFEKMMLVKGVEYLVPGNDIALSPIVEITRESVASSVASTDPFLYNPFENKKRHSYDQSSTTKRVVQKVLVAQGEVAHFEVTIHNPLSVGLPIERIALVSEGAVEWDTAQPSSLTFIIPPETTSAVVITGIPKGTGKATITKILLQFAPGWYEEWDLDASGGILKENCGDDVERGISVNILPPHPALSLVPNRVVLSDAKIYHKCTQEPIPVTLFEGEQISMELDVKSIIDGTEIRYVNVFCQQKMVPAMVEQQTPQDLFERELSNILHGAVVFDTESVKNLPLTCHKSMTLRFSVYGKRGCIGATILIEYGAALPDASMQSYHVRRLSIPISMTVHEVLVPLHMDILPFRYHKEYKHRRPSSQSALKPSGSVEELLLAVNESHGPKSQEDEKDYCLLTLDLRNNWRLPFTIHIRFAETDMIPAPDLLSKSSIVIQAFQTKRIIFPLKRVQLDQFLKDFSHQLRQDPKLPTADELIKRLRAMEKPCEPIDYFSSQFIATALVDDVIGDIPPVPVLNTKQYVASEYNKRPKKKSFYDDPVTGPKYWIHHKVNPATKKPSVEKVVDKYCWWYDEDEKQVGTISCLREREERLLFWYRDHLFRHNVLQIEWTIMASTDIDAVTPPRKGTLDIRKDLRLTSTMLSAYRRDLLDVSFDLIGNRITTEGFHRYRIDTCGKATLRIHLRPAKPGQIFLFRLQPLTTSSAFLCGCSEHIVSDSHDVEIPIVFHSAGRFTFVWNYQDTSPDMYVRDKACTIVWCTQPLVVQVGE